MKIKEKTLLGCEFFKTILFGLKKPLFVSWQLTQRCNLRCKYCLSSGNESDEIGPARAKEIITALRSMGTRVIRFTGGEPLLRKDLPMLLTHCHELGIYTGLATNGILFDSMVNEFRFLSAVSFSLDGPEDIHNALRGPGSHSIVLKAVETSRRHKIYTTLSVALSQFNINHIDYILDLAKKQQVKVFFQPVTKRRLLDDEAYQVYPDANLFKRAMEKLMSEKYRNKYIGNSRAALRHFSLWPQKAPINCVAGKIICRINANGQMFACPRYLGNSNMPTVKNNDVQECFNQLTPPCCGECWCSLFVELNLLSRLAPCSLIDAVN